MNRYLRAAGAAVILILLLAAIPAALVAMFANPLPGWADVYAGDVSDAAVLDVLATIVWISWAQFTIAVARELLAQLRLAPRPRITGFLPGQRLARTLITAIFLVGPATAAPVFAAPHASAAAPTATIVEPSRQEPPVSSPRGSPTAETIPSTRTLTIGDDGPFTFWELAQRHLGAGERWHEVWDLNQGRTQADGTTMIEPHWLRPGWTILVPTAAPAPQNDGTPSTSPRSGAVFSTVSMTIFGAGVGAGLLGGVTLSELLRRRHTQWRHRRPGRVPAGTPPELTATERKLLLHGPDGQQNAFALDHALRILARDLTRADAEPSDVTAVRIGAETIDLIHHAGPPSGTYPPSPWQIDPATRRWCIRREHVAHTDRQLRETQVPPYPVLVSIGTSTDQTPPELGAGDHWLLDLESVKVLTLTGDSHRCRNLIQFMIAELANNIWSELLEVTVAGFEPGLVAVNEYRVTCTNNVAQAVSEHQRHLNANREVLRSANLTDVLDGRFHDIAGDVWYPYILIVHHEAVTTDPHPAQTIRQIKQLADDLMKSSGRVGVALVLVGDLPAPDGHSRPESLPGTRLHIDADGQMLAPWGQTLTADLPTQTAAQLSGVLAAAGHTEDRPTPPARGQQPWDAFADATGAPRSDLTSAPETKEPSTPSRHDHADPDRLLTVVTETTGRSVLAVTSAAIRDYSASTTRDMTTLAPQISPDIRHQIEDADPDLDADLAAWHNPDTDRARLRLLGPVQVRALGSLPPDRPREPWNTEIVAYLAAHPRGVTSEQFGTDLWPDDPDIASKPKLRQAAFHARRWLGTDPLTGRPYIPSADAEPVGGLGAYQVNGLLIDAELFRRLRLRGTSSGPSGIADLQAALDLVTGPPYDRRRPNGYGWLLDTPLDVEYTAMVVDVAHLVATHHLTAHRPAQAADAARVALKTGSHDDVPLLDLVAACDAQGLQGEAAAWVKHLLSNHGAEVEEDLPPRTAEILFRRQFSHLIR